MIPTKTLLSLFGLKFLSHFIWDERDVVMSSSWRNTCHALIGRKKLKMSVKVSFSQRFLISQLLILQKSYLKTFLWFIAAVLDNDDLLKFSLNRNRSHNTEVWKKFKTNFWKLFSPKSSEWEVQERNSCSYIFWKSWSLWLSWIFWKWFQMYNLWTHLTRYTRYLYGSTVNYIHAERVIPTLFLE